jgi:hypothetical protein
MEALRNYEDAEDAIVVVMPSTRPENVHPNGAIPGAIRTMIFAPPPWDLLIWAEDQGKVCLADLRTGLRTRQVLKLEPNNADYTRVDMESSASDTPTRRHEDMDPEYNRLMRTYLAQEHGGASSPYDIDHELAIADALPPAQSRTNLARWADDTILTGREQDVLDSLRTAQSRLRTSTIPRPRSIHYPEMGNESRQSTAQQSSLFAQDFPALARQTGGAGGSEDLGPPATMPNTLRIMREYMREREVESLDHSTPPLGTSSSSSSTLRPFALSRREQDLDDALANTATSTSGEQQPPTLSERATLDQNDLTRSSAQRLLSTLRAAPHAHTSQDHLAERDTTTTTPSDRTRRRNLLRARERAFASTSTNPPTAGAAHPTSTLPSSTNLPNPALTTAQRSEIESLRYHNRLSSFVTRGDYYDPGMGFRTAGLAMDVEGRKLWAACDRGIFEFDVDLGSRKGMAGVEWK